MFGARPLSFAFTLIAFGSAFALSPGTRQLPARDIPVPSTASPAAQVLIGAPPPQMWNAHPKSAEEWKALAAQSNRRDAAPIPGLLQRFDVTSQPAVIGGVKTFILTPNTIPEANRNRVLVHVHGGGYVFDGGEAGTGEGVMMAGTARMKVISIDYRLPPDFPYPAAMDDAMAVWKEVVKANDPKKTAIFGTSTGGGMTLAMVLRAIKEGLPLPAAIAPGTPWSDITETGDTYFANEMLDNVLVSYRGWLGDAAKLYANGTDLKDPMLSPIYGDFHGFPPAILTTGTRDLFLSNTVRTHRKLRDAGIEAQLIVFEGLSHAQYLFDPAMPESKEHFREVTAFFERHLEE
jgi:monoterpene epsilon-lactone hydrolase